MRQDLSKAQKRRIRELSDLAYERDLSREMTALEEDFARWRRHEINVHALSDRIHQFHDGPSRKLFVAYSGNRGDLALASAIARGIVSEEEAGSEIVDLLKPAIGSYREDRGPGPDKKEGS